MLKTILSYLCVYLVWGSTYFAIRVAVETIEPFTILAIRFLLGGLLLLAVVYFKGYLRPMPPLRVVFNSCIIGSLLLIGGNGLVTIAEKHVDSYLAALIVAATPIVVLFYDRFLFRKRVHIAGWTGALTGLTGVTFLLIKENFGGFNFTPQIVLIIIAIGSWGLGTSLSKHLRLPEKSIVNGAFQLTSVGITAALIAFLRNGTSLLEQSSFTLRSTSAVLYLAVFGTIALVAFAYLLYNEPTERVVTYAFVNPLVAIGLGMLLLNEPPVPYLLPGAALIISGLLLMFYGEKLFCRKKIIPKSKSITALFQKERTR